METIIKQSADGIVLSGDNNFDTTQGKVFINNHEITDIDTFFKVAEENTRLINQQKEFIEYLEYLIKQNETVVEVSKYGLPKNCSKLLIDFYKEILSKYKKIIGSDINVGSIGGK